MLEEKSGPEKATNHFSLITKGTLNESLAHPREVFRAAIVHSAYALIVVHNLWVPIHKLCYVD